MTAIEALTGKKPATFVRSETGKLLWQENLNLDRRLIRIIDRLIELDLGQRYQSAEKVLNDLRKINGYDGLDRVNSTLLRSRAASRQKKRLPVPLLVGILGAICLLGSIEFAFPTIRPIYYRERGLKFLPEAPQAALEIFDRAIDLKLDWRSLLGRGDALAEMERYPEALKAYNEAAELNPERADSWKKQGDLLLRQENFTDAIRCLR